jgi:hypothetical protein
MQWQTANINENIINFLFKTLVILKSKQFYTLTTMKEKILRHSKILAYKKLKKY